MGLEQLRAGDIMVGPIGGAAGAFIGAAQLALATVEPGWVWRTGVKEWFRKRHCGVVVEVPPMSLAPRLVQAMPGGAEEIELTPERHWTPEYVYIRPAYQTADPTFALDMPEHPYAIGQAQLVADIARGFVGTPYDFKTYGAIPPYRAGLRIKALEGIIAGTDTMMCSRLVDASLAAAGYHLFNDGRLPGNVTPSEAYRRLRQLPHSVLHGGLPGWVDYRNI